MNVRVVKGGKGNRGGRPNPTQTITYSCSHIAETFYEDGIKLELCNIDGREGMRKIVRLPRDGHTAYFMEGGKNFDIKRWPPRSKERYLSRGGVIRDGGEDEDNEVEGDEQKVTDRKLQMRG